MVFIPGETFNIGSGTDYESEKSANDVTVDSWGISSICGSYRLQNHCGTSPIKRAISQLKRRTTATWFPCLSTS